MTSMMEKPRYRALNLLETQCAPTWKGRPPFWRPTPPSKVTVYTPVFSWRHRDYDLFTCDASMVDLDVNGAYVAAISGVTVAHGPLEHTGPLGDATTNPLPGYYLIDRHEWTEWYDMPSPLGTGLTDHLRLVWVAHPTVQLLAKLARDGEWPPVTVHDSWTCPTPVRLYRWAERIRDDRAHALTLIRASHPGTIEREQAQATYDAIKDGYSMACSMMLGRGEEAEDPEEREYKSKTRRPDWTHAIYAAHAAGLWRKIYRLRGRMLAVGDTDEVTLTLKDLEDIVSLGSSWVLQMDPSGLQIGAFKVKRADDPHRAYAAEAKAAGTAALGVL